MEHRAQIKRQTSRWVLILFFAVCLGGTVSADESKDLSAEAAKMNTNQKLARGTRYVRDIKRIYNWIFTKLKEARKAQDLPATDCLGDKLTATKALLFLAEKAKVNLQESSSKDDKEKINYHYVELAQSAARCRDIEVEAKLCRGKGGFYDGKTKVIVSGANPLGGKDATVPPWTDPIVVRKVDASSFF